MCPCGHELLHHDGAKGPCHYGKGNVFGGCGCLGYRSGRYREEQVPPQEMPTIEAPLVRVVVETLREIDAMREALMSRRGKLVVALAAMGVHSEIDLVVSKPLARAPKLVRVEPRPPATKPEGDAKLRAGERKILEVLARHHPVKLTRSRLGPLVGIKARGTTFTAYLGVLKRGGLVADDGGLVVLTSAGLARACVTKASPMTRAEIVSQWMSGLRAGERKILETVVEKGEIDRDDLGEIVDIDPAGTTLTAYLGVLKRNDLITVSGRRVALGEALARAS